MERIFSKLSRSKLYNIYDVYDDYVEIRFSNSDEVFIIDREDLDKIYNYPWYPKRSHWDTYCSGYINKKVITLHRFLMKAELGQYVDHIDKNTFNTRKNNLRFVSNQENGFNRKVGKNNSSGIMGVVKHKDKWTSRIKINYKHLYLGIFEEFEDAAKCRLKAEKYYFGKFAPQRHLFEKYGIV